jgi:hypothetical protein
MPGLPAVAYRGVVMGDLIDTRLREPTIEEREMGYHLVRLCESEIEAQAITRERCGDCVFRFGTVPNTTAETLLTVTECLHTGEPFLCAHEPGMLPCAGWAALRKTAR